MARGRLSEEEVKILRQNPYVSDVEETRIIYTNEFKFLFMKEYLEGKKPTQIFKDSGFDTKMLGSKRIERAAYRWRKSYETGGLGSYKDGTIRKNKKGEKQKRELIEKYLEMLSQQQKKIEALEAEVEKLRKQLSS